jgi:hypothetical protein
MLGSQELRFGDIYRTHDDTEIVEGNATSVRFGFCSIPIAQGIVNVVIDDFRRIVTQ